jgi:hypothetical protein
MPNITFSSPLHKDKTIYAVAGSHTQTILQLAKDEPCPDRLLLRRRRVRHLPGQGQQCRQDQPQQVRPHGWPAQRARGRRTEGDGQDQAVADRADVRRRSAADRMAAGLPVHRARRGHPRRVPEPVIATRAPVAAGGRHPGLRLRGAARARRGRLSRPRARRRARRYGRVHDAARDRPSLRRPSGNRRRRLAQAEARPGDRRHHDVAGPGRSHPGQRRATSFPSPAHRAFDAWMRRKPVDIGNTVRRNLVTFRQTGLPLAPPSDHDAGNGAAMRVLPVALAKLGAAEADVRAAVRAQAQVTHHNALSDQVCEFLTLAVQDFLCGRSLPEMIDRRIHAPARETSGAFLSRPPAARESQRLGPRNAAGGAPGPARQRRDSRPA